MNPINKLSGQDWQELHSALLAGFPTEDELVRMVTFRLAPDLRHSIARAELATMAFRLIEVAESRGLLGDLIQGMRYTRPKNPEIQRIAEKLQLAPVAVVFAPDKAPERVTAAGLERIVQAQIPLLPSREWRERYGEIEGRVCRIEVGQGQGSGFFIGPGTVLTAYHVIKAVHHGAVAPSTVRIRFDVHSRLSNAGVAYSLANNWLLHHTTPAADEETPGRPVNEPEENELDFAVLAIDGEPGRDKLGGKGSPLDPVRGWIALPRTPVVLAENDPVMILGHPAGEDMQLSIDTAGFIESSASGNRIRYRTNTKGGSSGSPVFNLSWSLVALHHMGDPGVAPAFKSEYNQAIPIGRIVENLRQAELLDSVSSLS